MNFECNQNFSKIELYLKFIAGADSHGGKFCYLSHPFLQETLTPPPLYISFLYGETILPLHKYPDSFMDLYDPNKILVDYGCNHTAT